MATFVLVHGAWHGGWCWERVEPLLSARGHKVIAPDLPGLGQDETPIESLTMQTWVDHMVELIDTEADPVILVGHSRGGVVISEIAERIPEKIGRLIYLTAFMLPHGVCMQDAFAEILLSEGGADFMDPSPDLVSLSIKTDMVGPVFYNRTEDEWVQRARDLVRPEPLMSFLSPVAISDERFGKVERVYIECTQDLAIPLELQRKFRDALTCEKVVTLESDHSPFFSMPEELVNAFDSLAA